MYRLWADSLVHSDINWQMRTQQAMRFLLVNGPIVESHWPKILLFLALH